MIFLRYRLQTKQSICNSFLTKKPMKPLSPLRKNSHIDLFYVCYSVTVSSEFKSSVSSDDVVSISADSDEEAYGSSCLGSEGSTVSSVDSVEEVSCTNPNITVALPFQFSPKVNPSKLKRSCKTTLNLQIGDFLL